MQRWVRLHNKVVQEIVTYNPFELVNENFHHLFLECNNDQVDIFWSYDEETRSFNPPQKPEESLEPPLLKDPVGVSTN